jgi:hypothetical protein
MNTLRDLRTVSSEELEELFQEATKDAVEKAWAAGLYVTGTVNGRRARVYPDNRIEYIDQ